jgi:cell division protein FtsQ
LSEVDLTDTEDVKVLTSDPNGEVLVHLGTGNYLQRYKIYVTHVQAWRQQFTKLDSVDLRYDGQIIVNPDLEGMPRQPALTQAAAKAALAAGVKNAAIVNYEKFVTHPAPPTIGPKQVETKPKAAGKSGAKPAPKSESKAASKAGSKAIAHHATVKPKAKGKNSPPSHASARPATAKPAITGKVQPDPGNTSTKAVPDLPTATKAAKPAPVVASPVVASGQKKPSAGIPQENPQN